MKFPFLSALALALTCRGLAAQEVETLRRQIDELANRVEELEDQQAATAERIGERAVVQAYNATTLDLGGHASSLFSYMRGEADDEAGHVVTLIELYLRAQLDDHWSLFATPGFYSFNGALLDNPATAVRGDPTFVGEDPGIASVLFTRAYGQWKPDDLLQVRGGVIGSPHGTTNREFFIPARTIGLGSLHTRIFPQSLVYPQVVQGLGASGKWVPGSSDWLEYDVYFGVEHDSASDPVGGLRLAWVFDDIGLSAAVNYGVGSRTSVLRGLGTDPAVAAAANVPVFQSPFAPGVLGGRDYEFVGIDIDWRSGPWIAKTEAYVSAEDSYADQRVFSTEWTWFATSEWGFSYRFDYYDAGSDQSIVSLSPFATVPMARGVSTEHVVGICYNPDPGVRIRLDAHHNNLPNSGDAVDFLNLSWSISF